MSQEALLLQASRVRPDPDKIARLARRVDPGPFAWLAKIHGVSALCARALAAADAPDALRDAVDAVASPARMRTLELSGLLVRLMSRFEAEGIPVLPLKGPTLALLAYRDLGLRTFRDLDLLVRPDDWRATVDLLVTEGFVPGFPPALVSGRALAESPFWRPDRDLEIDVHTISSRPWLDLPISVDDRARHVDVTLGGREIPTLRPEDLLVYLAVHGGKHGWERLAWAADVAFLLHHHPNAAWEESVRWARASGVLRLLLIGAGVARKLLDAALPEALAGPLRADEAAIDLVERAAGSLFGPGWEDRPRLDRAVFQWRSRERLRDRARWLSMRILEPTLDDVRFAPRAPRLARPVRVLAGLLLGTSGCLPADADCVWRTTDGGALVCFADRAGLPVAIVDADAPVAVAPVLAESVPAWTSRVDALAPQAAKSGLLLVFPRPDSTAADVAAAVRQIAQDLALSSDLYWAGYGAGADRLTGELIPAEGADLPGVIVSNCGGATPDPFLWTPTLENTADMPVYFSGGGDAVAAAADAYRAAGFARVELDPVAGSTGCDPAEDWDARTIGRWSAFQARND